MTSQTTEHDSNTNRIPLDQLITAGGAWARYGLSVGQLALETSAKTLVATARVLSALADQIDPREGQEKPEEPEVVDAPVDQD